MKKKKTNKKTHFIFPEYNHFSKSSNLEKIFNYNYKYKQLIKSSIKPTGFWFSINGCLIDWGELEFGKLHNLYSIHGINNNITKSIYVNKYSSKILLLETIDEIINFDKRFGNYNTTKFLSSNNKTNTINNDNISNNSEINKIREIKWNKVSKYYSGIIIFNYKEILKQLQNKKKYIKNRDIINKNIYINSLDWISTFDFSSGCIWDLKAIKNLKLNKNNNFNKYRKYYKNNFGNNKLTKKNLAKC